MQNCPWLIQNQFHIQNLHYYNSNVCDCEWKSYVLAWWFTTKLDTGVSGLKKAYTTKKFQLVFLFNVLCDF